MAGYRACWKISLKGEALVQSGETVWAPLLFAGKHDPVQAIHNLKAHRYNKPSTRRTQAR